MTSAEIQALIDLITVGGLNTATEAKNIWQALKDELFSAQVIDDQTTEIYVQKAGSTIPFNLRFKKVGNNGYLWIRFRNSSSSSVIPQNILTFRTTVSGNPNPIRPLLSDVTRFRAYNGANYCELLLTNNVIAIGNTLAPSSTWYETNYEFYITQ